MERDLPQLGINVSSTRLRRFWNMLAHYHGQIWNASEFARSFGVADTTVRQYLDRLTDALVVRQIQPWHEKTSAPRLTRSMHIAMHDLKLKQLFVIHAGEHSFPLAENIKAVPVSRKASMLSFMLWG